MSFAIDSGREQTESVTGVYKTFKDFFSDRTHCNDVTVTEIIVRHLFIVGGGPDMKERDIHADRQRRRERQTDRETERGRWKQRQAEAGLRVRIRGQDLSESTRFFQKCPLLTVHNDHQTIIISIRPMIMSDSFCNYEIHV